MNPSNQSNQSNPNPVRSRQEGPPDDGLRTLLTWTFIALGVTLLLAIIGVTLVIYWFDPGPTR